MDKLSGNDVFVSYARPDAELAKRLAEMLWNEGVLSLVQTFYWPNNVPQHDRMNRGWWRSVEQWERNLAVTAGKAVGFAGPVLRSDDPVHARSEEVIGRLRVRANFRLPQRFWKLVVTRGADGELACAAFFIDQAALLTANAPLGNTPDRYQVPLDRLKAQTGLVFDGLDGAADLPVG